MLSLCAEREGVVCFHSFPLLFLLLPIEPNAACSLKAAQLNPFFKQVLIYESSFTSVIHGLQKYSLKGPLVKIKSQIFN